MNLPPVQQRKESLSMDERWVTFRNLMVRQVLEECDGNQCHAAKALKVHRNTLARWKKEALKR